MEIGGPIIISMKTIIFILAISAIAAPVFSATCTGAALASGTCVSCETATTTNCNACNAGYYLNTAKACVLCGGGKGKAAGTAGDAAAAGSADNSVCDVTCTGNCETCTTAAVCLNCKAGYYLSTAGAAGACSLCPTLKGKLADTTVPAAASTTSGATECAVASMGGCNHNNGVAGGMGCLSCKAGYYLSAAGVCSWCTGGKGKAIDAAVVAAPDTTGATCTVTCSTANCQACGAEADKAVCLACNSGRSLTTASPATCEACAKDTYFSATNTCTACPAAKPSRAAPTTPVTAVETDSVCMAAAGSGSSATLIQALCGASVAAYALF